MENNYLVKEAKIIGKKKEAADIFLFTLKFKDGTSLNFNPGQFILAGIPGFGESAFDVCSPAGKTFQICARKVGVNTEKMVDLKVGDSIFIRGPYGNGFPLKNFRNENLLLIGGGTGFIVIRGLMQHLFAEGKNNRKIQIFYGARDWNSLLFKDEFDSWKKIAGIHLILENPPKKSPCSKGLITELFEIAPIIEKPAVIMCGPPVMYKFCLQKINEKLQVPENKIYLSLERRMHCGIGVCQHCAIGPKYVCKDGPVFTYEELKTIKEAL
jgi:NAD(P)H-flavin reductase